MEMLQLSSTITRGVKANLHVTSHVLSVFCCLKTNYSASHSIYDSNLYFLSLLELGVSLIKIQTHKRTSS